MVAKIKMFYVNTEEIWEKIIRTIVILTFMSMIIFTINSSVKVYELSKENKVVKDSLIMKELNNVDEKNFQGDSKLDTSLKIDEYVNDIVQGKIKNASEKVSRTSLPLDELKSQLTNTEVDQYYTIAINRYLKIYTIMMMIVKIILTLIAYGLWNLYKMQKVD